MSDIQNTTSVETISVGKSNLVTDLDSLYINKDSYTYGRNLMPATHLGNIGSRTNEKATLECFKLPFPFVGAIPLPDETLFIITGDGSSTEIGIGDYKTCRYKKLFITDCIKANPCKIITGVAKSNYKNEFIVIFGGESYPIFRLNLSKIPYNYTIDEDSSCQTKEFNKTINCEELLLFKNITIPKGKISSREQGLVPNGSYSVQLAYNIDDVKYSDYYNVSNQIHLFSKKSSNSLVLELEDLDRDFDKYNLILVSNIDGVISNFDLGSFSTNQNTVEISSIPTQTVGFEQLISKKNNYQSAGIISSNSQYLMLADITPLEDINYQLQAMNIKAEYTVEQVSVDFYKEDPQEFSYWADENYNFEIEWLHTSGYVYPKSHIPGRKATADDKSIATGNDVFEIDYELPASCKKRENIEKWEIENTASQMKIKVNSKFVCNRRLYATGELGYHESSFNYEPNPLLYGEDACTPIRLHRMPDRCIVPRYSKIDGKTYINILGVQFSNIEYPKDKNGNPIKGIVGYRILRSSRDGGNRTVISAGMATNVRSYNDKQSNKEIYYANYGLNHSGVDPFLSSTQTVFKNNKETNYNGLSIVHNDKFNYYSPHNHFDFPYKSGNEWKFENEEKGKLVGSFQEVDGHPKFTLLTNFALYISLALGLLQAYLALNGKKCKETLYKTSAEGASSGTSITEVYQECETLLHDASKAKTPTGKAGESTDKALNPAKTVLSFLAKALKKVLAVFNVAFLTLEFAENLLTSIYNFTRPINYAYQYNGKYVYDSITCLNKGNIRRVETIPSKLLPADLIEINDITINNYSRETSYFLQLNKGITQNKFKDESLKSANQAGLCGDISRQFETDASCYYVRNKIYNPSQYGRIGSTKSVAVSGYIPVTYKKDEDIYSTPLLYGGDCVLGAFTFLKKMPLFRQNAATTIGNELGTNFPDNTDYNYRLYRNVGYARYWCDSTRYNTSQIFTTNITNFARFSRTLTSKHNLDCKYKDGNNVFRVDDSYFYTSHNTAVEFIAEADFNFTLRANSTRPHYSSDNRDLNKLFKAPLLWFEEEFKLDKGYRKLEITELFNKYLPADFKYEINNRRKNDVIYSLPSFNLQNQDNWQYFLPANYFSFQQSDFGNLTAIHKIDQDRLIFLFDRSSPFVSVGRDFLELDNSGRKITVGDGGLFAQDPRETMPTDTNYGSCQSRHAYSSNHFGFYYPSEVHGRQHRFSQQLDDFSREGNYYWHKQYMPIQLKERYPEYNKQDNTLCGVGYLMVFDSTYEILYTTKRDFYPKDERIVYNVEKEQFELDGYKIELTNTDYFEDISWTFSYSPIEKGFIAWHDWHPDWVIQTDKHFLSVKDNAIWKHNERCDLFCNYYGKDYPFAIETNPTTGQEVTTQRSIEYNLEAFTYNNNCRDKFHKLHENFDTLVVYNSEQMSPPLTIVKSPEVLKERVKYPKLNTRGGYDILFTKEEQKYRINQFWDCVKDRGEFTNNEFHLWQNDRNGYTKSQNPRAIDINKQGLQTKKFRHNYNKFLFAKTVSKDKQYVIKLFNYKNLKSIR